MNGAGVAAGSSGLHGAGARCVGWAEPCAGAERRSVQGLGYWGGGAEPHWASLMHWMSKGEGRDARVAKRELSETRVFVLHQDHMP